MRVSDTSLYVIRLINNALVSWTLTVALRVLFFADTLLLVPGDLIVVLFGICATVLGRLRPGVLIYFLAYAGMLCGVFLNARSDPLSGVLRAIICVLIAVFALYSRLNAQEHIRPSFSEAVLFVGVYYLSYAADRPALRTLAITGMMLFISLCVLNMGSENMLRALAGFHHRAAVPYERIRRLTAGLLGGSVALSLLWSVLAAGIDDGGRLFRLIREWLLGILRAILSRLAEGIESSEEQVEMAQQSGAGMPEGMLLPETGPQNDLLVKILDALFTALAVAIAILLLVLLVRTIKDLYRRFVENGKRRGVVKEYLRPGERSERIVSLKTHSAERGPGLKLTPDATIRRQYIRLIRHMPNASGIRDSETPMELERTAAQQVGSPLLASSGEEAGALPEEVRRLYEKARYAPHSCTAADARLFKSLVRHLS